MTQTTITRVDIMERVAHHTDGPEPTEEDAARWLAEHSEAIEQVMYYAADNYTRDHWKESK